VPKWHTPATRKFDTTRIIGRCGFHGGILQKHRKVGVVMTITKAEVLANATPCGLGTVTSGDEGAWQDGYNCGKLAEEINIAINNVWSACMKNGGTMQSYERIGYHAKSGDRLNGMIASGATIKVHRVGDDNKLACFELKG
jgi:hypothetical protein